MNKIMIHRKLQEVYKSLAKRETRVRGTLLNVYNAHTAEVQDIVASAYQSSIQSDGSLKYSRLYNDVSPASRLKLKQDAMEVDNIFKNQHPFSNTKFDKLNRAEVLTSQQLISELKTAEITYQTLKDHLWSWGRDLFRELANAIDSEIAEEDIEDMLYTIFNNSKYPIIDSIYQDAFKCAYEMNDKTITGIIREDELQKTMRNVAEYTRKRELTDADRLMQTEGTYLTMEVVKDVVGDKAEYFYTQTMEDEKVCQLCADMQARQKKKPVPMADMKPGVNAPPFHPYCRCGIEVVWK